MEYEDRFIIYIDVLGFSNFVNYTSLTKVNGSEKIRRIESYLAMIRNYFKAKEHGINISETRQVTSFSDLIIVSINLDEVDNIDYEISEVFYLLINSLHKGFLLRGSIVYGKLIHTKDVIFGPGLIDAYNKEKSIAKFPRIIIDEAIVSDLKDLPLVDHPVRNFIDFISRDFDGYYYIDCFKCLRSHVDNFWQYTRILDSCCDILISMSDNPTLLEKYNWLRNTFEKHIESNSDALNYSFGKKEISEHDLEIFKLYLREFDNNAYKKIL